MRAPNCPYIFRTGLLGVVCLITFEEQPVRDVVRLLAAVMLVVGGSRISVTALGRLVGLGAPPFGAAPIVNFNRTSTTTTTTTTVCNASLKACIKMFHQARWFVRTELGGCHALELKSGGFRSRRRVSRAKTAWHGESNNNRQATTNMPLRDSSSHHSADSDLESKQLPSSFTVRRRGPPVKRRFGALTPRQTELRTLAGTSK